MRINQKYKLRKIAGECVVIMQGEYGVDFTKIISFNETSEWLWNNFFDKEFTSKDVEELLLSRFEVNRDIAARDALNWIEKLITYHLIEK